LDEVFVALKDLRTVTRDKEDIERIGAFKSKALGSPAVLILGVLNMGEPSENPLTLKVENAKF